MSERKPEQVILYHGSIDELNNRTDSDSYDLVSNIRAITIVCDNREQIDSLDALKRNLDNLEDEVKDKIFSRGYDGIVNRRSFFTDHYYFVEGTPVRRLPIEQ